MGSRLRNTVNGVGFLRAATDLDDAWIIFDELPDGFAAQTPDPGKLANAIVLLEGGVHNRHNLLNGGSVLNSPTVTFNVA